MKQYIATFHTHVSAMLTNRNLKIAGLRSKMMPVPRKLSSSCGTCVAYEAEEPRIDLTDVDMEAVYEIVSEHQYNRIFGDFETITKGHA